MCPSRRCPYLCSCLSSVCLSLNTSFVRILVSSFLDPRVPWQNNPPIKEERILLHDDGIRRRRSRPYPAGSLICGVRRGILRARFGDRAPRRGNPPSISARGKVPAPYGSPRHYRIVLERGDLPVSGKLPVPSRNQPTSVSAGPAELFFVFAGSAKLFFAGPA